MPPKKKSHAAKAAPQPAASDYDTDPNYTDTGVPMAAIPPPPARTNDELNMLVLRRWYPSVQSIIAIAPFAVVYVHDHETQTWEKTDNQGTLFVCRLQDEDAAYPTYRAIILNRKNPENWTFDISSSEDIQFTDMYVIVQRTEDTESQVYGIWIYSDGETVPDTRQVVYGTISDCAAQAEAYTAQYGTDTEEVYEEYTEDETTGYMQDLKRQQELLRLEQQKTREEERRRQTLGEQHSHQQIPDQQQQAPVSTFIQPNMQAPLPAQMQQEGQRIDINALFAKPQPSQQPVQPPSQQSTLLNLFKR